MLDSVLDVFDGVLSVGEGLNEGTNEIPENREIKNSEGVEYSEGDIERIETAAEIMGEVFTDEVISNWENLSVEERTAYLDEYYARAGEVLGIDTKGVYVEDLYEKYGYGTQGVNGGDGYLGIDIRLVSDPSNLEDLLNTTTHEMRHQLQNDALRNPDAFPDIPKETLAQWAYEFDNYVDPSYDFEGYQSQAIETDARAFAEEVVEEYLSDSGTEARSTTANYEIESTADVAFEGGQLAASAESLSAREAIEPDSVEISDIKNELENLVNEDIAAVNKMNERAESTETFNGPDDLGTVVKQGMSCGSGKGCMGSHSCGGGYT